MIRCLLSRSGKKQECQNMVVMAVGLPCMNTTGIGTDGWLYSEKETMIVVGSQIMVLSMTKFRL